MFDYTAPVMESGHFSMCMKDRRALDPAETTAKR